jgi:hypothetical protein
LTCEKAQDPARYDDEWTRREKRHGYETTYAVEQLFTIRNPLSPSPGFFLKPAVFGLFRGRGDFSKANATGTFYVFAGLDYFFSGFKIPT